MLKTITAFDADIKNTYSIRVQVSDGYGGDYEQTFSIIINSSFVSPPGISKGGVGLSVPDSNNGKSVGDGTVTMNVSNPTASVSLRLSL